MKKEKAKTESKLENSLLKEFALWGVRTPVRQYSFHDERKWAFDFAWPSVKIAIEIQGGIYSGGAHTRGAGYEKDNDKANAAVAAGWRLYRFGPNALTINERKALFSPALLFMHGVLKREGLVHENNSTGSAGTAHSGAGKNKIRKVVGNARPRGRATI